MNLRSWVVNGRICGFAGELMGRHYPNNDYQFLPKEMIYRAIHRGGKWWQLPDDGCLEEDTNCYNRLRIMKLSWHLLFQAPSPPKKGSLTPSPSADEKNIFSFLLDLCPLINIFTESSFLLSLHEINLDDRKFIFWKSYHRMAEGIVNTIISSVVWKEVFNSCLSS